LPTSLRSDRQVTSLTNTLTSLTNTLGLLSYRSFPADTPHPRIEIVEQNCKWKSESSDHPVLNTSSRYDRAVTLEDVPASAPELEAIRGLRIERSTTAERVAASLRTLIIKGDLPPGSPLREGALVQALGVSRNTLREAFRLLSSDGLVVHQMHRGVDVKRLAESDVRDIYRTRLPLELAAIERSAELPKEGLHPIREVVEQAAEALQKKDWKELATLDLIFHQRLVDLLDSRRISAFFEAVLAELRLAFAIPSDQESFLGPFVPWNDKLCGLLESGRREECAQEMRLYLERAEELIQSFLRQAAEPSGEQAVSRGSRPR
jgi:DNA-binding GntR family transcriptional regulator